VTSADGLTAVIARIRTFLGLWNSDEDIIGFTEEFRLDPADVTAVLDELERHLAAPRPVAIVVDFNSTVSREQMDRWLRTWNERNPWGKRAEGH
jgi:hypothetical protein